MSPSLFTHNFVRKLSLGRLVASQRAVSSSTNTGESALNPCNLQIQYTLSPFYPRSFHSSIPTPFAKAHNPHTSIIIPLTLSLHSPIPTLI